MRQRSFNDYRYPFLSCFLLGVLAATQNVCGIVSTDPTRRSFLQNLHNGALLLQAGTACPVASQAREGSEALDIDRGGRPFAPLQALLPLTRLKLWFDNAYDLSCTLTAAGSNHKRLQYEVLAKMDEVLSHPPKLFIDEKVNTRTRTSTAQITTDVSKANKAQYQKNRSELSLPDRMAAMLNQADVERQWGMLQYAESQREKGNEMRAAFNFYVSQLTFAESYLLTAPKEDRKRMIRNNELPTITAVITSDLDLRDLYRNQFLTAMDDARAEVSYQLRHSADSVDVSDVLDLMNEANTAFVNWFALIASRDVTEAIKVVSNEQHPQVQ